MGLEAQVYLLDKNQKWSPLTNEVVPVSFIQNPASRVTRICAYRSAHSKELVVNSEIHSSMQYRRPTETFVQWFDSQNVLYGLNLTSIADAEGFQKEFDIATGRKQREGGNAMAGQPSLPPKSQSGSAVNLASGAKGPSGSPNLRPGLADRQQTPLEAELKAKLNKSFSKLDVSNGTESPRMPPSTSAAKKSNETIGGAGDYSTPNRGAVDQQFGRQQQPRQMDRSAGDLSALSGSGDDGKLVAQLKSKIKELEMQNISLTADNAALQETSASQTKHISTLNQQLESLQTDLDKLRAGFQQNATSAGLWKQKLEDYQQSNDALTLKVQRLRELYSKFGDILKPSDD